MIATVEKPLSDKQERILEAIKGFWRERGYGPSLRDIQDRASISSSSVVAYNLAILTMRGLIVFDPEKARTAQVVRQPGEPCPVCGCDGSCGGKG